LMAASSLKLIICFIFLKAWGKALYDVESQNTPVVDSLSVVIYT